MYPINNIIRLSFIMRLRLKIILTSLEINLIPFYYIIVKVTVNPILAIWKWLLVQSCVSLSTSMTNKFT